MDNNEDLFSATGKLLCKNGKTIKIQLKGEMMAFATNSYTETYMFIKYFLDE